MDHYSDSFFGVSGARGMRLGVRGRWAGSGTIKVDMNMGEDQAAYLRVIIITSSQINAPFSVN